MSISRSRYQEQPKASNIRHYSGAEAPVLGNYWGTRAASSREAYRSLYGIKPEWGNTLRQFTLGYFKGVQAEVSLASGGTGVQVAVSGARPRFYITWPWF